jgi:thiamine biosynthesis lipoprotein
VVNAGGDLRVFGDATEPVHVRLPEDRGFTALPVGLREAAAAGSGAAWTDSSRMSDVIDPSTGQRVHVTHTFLAVAPQGIIAEMLTKLALLQDPRLGRIARQYDAMLYRVDASGIVEELDLS